MTDGESETVRRRSDAAVFLILSGITLIGIIGGSHTRGIFPPGNPIQSIPLLFVVFYILLFWSSVFLFLSFPSHLGFYSKTVLIVSLFTVSRIFVGVTGSGHMALDLMILVLLMLVLHQRKQDIRWAMAYGMNPIVVFWGASQKMPVLVLQSLILAGLNTGFFNKWNLKDVSVAAGLVLLIIFHSGDWHFSESTLIMIVISAILFSVVIQSVSFLFFSLFMVSAFILPSIWPAMWLAVFMLLLVHLHKMKELWATMTVNNDLFADKPVHVSVVIPVKNEGMGIQDCIRRIKKDGSVCEMIVVDGGSTDKTVEIAEREGVKVIIHDAPPGSGGGRGGQIKRGMEEAVGDIVAVVHADTRIHDHVFTRMVEMMSANNDVIGGACGARFDNTSYELKFIELLNHFRAVFLKISFGDQIQFVKRRTALDMNLFSGIPLMEDVEFSLRMKRVGRVVYLFGASEVSSRRWEAYGRRNGIMVLKNVFYYLFRRLWGVPDTAAMYKIYYKTF